EGHWGFQYYLEAAGAKALVKDHSSVQPGDWIVIPVNATSLWPLKKEPTRQVGTIAVPGPEYLTTWNGLAGGGFYASTRGPVPFAFGPVPPEKATVYEVEPPAAHPPE
ncbi:MAG TPA: hypothetical protein VN625_00910, partial [Desulfuromonadaceae bacterium]|nr:hypothetical protein [Desulfuromonadaceae bacterium]